MIPFLTDFNLNPFIIGVETKPDIFTTSLNFPSGTENGDLMILFYKTGAAGGTTITLPSGWTSYYEENVRSTTNVYIVGICYKTKTSGDGSSLSFAGTNIHGAFLASFRGYKTLRRFLKYVTPINQETSVARTNQIPPIQLGGRCFVINYECALMEPTSNQDYTITDPTTWSVYSGARINFNNGGGVCRFLYTEPSSNQNIALDSDSWTPDSATNFSVANFQLEIV